MSGSYSQGARIKQPGMPPSCPTAFVTLTQLGRQGALGEGGERSVSSKTPTSALSVSKLSSGLSKNCSFSQNHKDFKDPVDSVSQGKVKPCSLAKDELGLCGRYVIGEGREWSSRLTLEVEPWMVVGGPERAEPPMLVKVPFTPPEGL